MEAISKVDLLDRYSVEKDIEVIEKSNPDLFGNCKIKKTYIKSKKYYCKKGDKLIVITKNAAAYCGAVVVENDKKERFAISWKDITIC